MTHLTIPVAELRPGDEWYSLTHNITVTAVIPLDDPTIGAMTYVRSGRRTWCWPSTMTVDVRRP